MLKERFAAPLVEPSGYEERHLRVPTATGDPEGQVADPDILIGPSLCQQIRC